MYILNYSNLNGRRKITFKKNVGQYIAYAYITINIESFIGYIGNIFEEPKKGMLKQCNLFQPLYKLLNNI